VPQERLLTTPIYMSRPFLPDLAEMLPLLQDIWDRRVLTNGGPYHQKLEAALGQAFDGRQVSLVSNGMLALTVAIDAAGLEGEVITTPYSFVATTHSVKMGRLTPVFVDIRPDDLNIDPDRIEAAITPRTCAVVAVHCYGNPCAVEAIEAIAQRHGLAVIYDAAHAFGARVNGQSLLAFGDYATLSFHATKVFNTFEGGAIVTGSAENKVQIDVLKNFGITSESSIPAIGGNAKMSEFNAALGLLQLNHFAEVVRRRGEVDARYRAALDGVEGIHCLAIPGGVEPNYSYFPILVGAGYGESRDELYERLKTHGVYARRYFYPLLSGLDMYRHLPSAASGNLPVAVQTADEVLCLPIYPGLSVEEQDRVIAAIAEKVR
jgi:dTDP-4-amino-4,6-dideoxygalactose transaminase